MGSSDTEPRHQADEWPADSREDALMEAHADIAALGLVPDVKTFLEAEADKVSRACVREGP